MGLKPIQPALLLGNGLVDRQDRLLGGLVAGGLAGLALELADDRLAVGARVVVNEEAAVAGEVGMEGDGVQALLRTGEHTVADVEEGPLPQRPLLVHDADRAAALDDVEARPVRHAVIGEVDRCLQAIDEEVRAQRHVGRVER